MSFGVRRVTVDPRFASFESRPACSSPRRASRTVPWLTLSRRASSNSRNGEPGGYTPWKMPSRTCCATASTREAAVLEDATGQDYHGKKLDSIRNRSYYRFNYRYLAGWRSAWELNHEVPANLRFFARCCVLRLGTDRRRIHRWHGPR